MVSIVVPIFNAEKYLSQTIRSIIGQTYRNLEIILINDGSKDNSLQIAESFKKKDSRIKIINTENYGAPHARNIGIDCARGESVIFFDSDDIMLPNCVSLLLEEKKQSGCDLIIGLKKDSTQEYDNKYTEDNIVSVVEAMYFDPFPGTKLYDLRLIKDKNVRFSNLKIGQDLNFYIKYLSVAKGIALINTPVSIYRIVKGSISHKASINILDIIKSFDDAENFTKNIIRDDSFTRTINDLRIIHFSVQFFKYSLIKKKKERKMVFDILYHEINKSATELSYKMSENAKNYFNMVNNVYRKKRIYLSSIYCWLKRKKYKDLY